jgi:hypothetical protein
VEGLKKTTEIVSGRPGIEPGISVIEVQSIAVRSITYPFPFAIQRTGSSAFILVQEVTGSNFDHDIGYSEDFHG